MSTHNILFQDENKISRNTFQYMECRLDRQQMPGNQPKAIGSTEVQLAAEERTQTRSLTSVGVCWSLISSYGPSQANMYLHTCAKCAFTSSCACAKYLFGLCSPLIHSIIPNDSVSGKRSLIWAFAVRACPEDTFWHGVAHIMWEQGKGKGALIPFRRTYVQIILCIHAV